MAEAAQPATRQRTRITVTRDGMSAMLVLHAPNQGEAELTLEEVKLDLLQANVVSGVKEETILKALDDKSYNTPLLVAQGTPPEKGENTRFTYNFDPTNNHSPHEDRNGHIDYKQINFIQNATKDQVLATRTAPTPGVPGVTVTGLTVQPAPARNIPFRSGTNTYISEDTMTLFASTSGAIVFRNGEISVKDVMVISGDVDHNIGNLDCRGSLKVTGDIKAGFNICVDGDLEVNGSVEDATIMAKGSIMVKGGFFGNGQGVMNAEGNITLKFAEGQRITCGGDLTIGGELINCNITAKGSVFMKGKRGKIVGGETRAGKEIRAAKLGTDAGTATVLAVAYDADLMRKYYGITKEIARIKADSQRIKDALYSLYRLQMDGKLTPEKLEALKKLEGFQQELPSNIEALEKQKAEIEEKMRELKDARIIAEDTIYPGVRAHFGLVYKDILETFEACKLTMEGYSVVMSEFKPTR